MNQFARHAGSVPPVPPQGDVLAQPNSTSNFDSSVNFSNSSDSNFPLEPCRVAGGIVDRDAFSDVFQRTLSQPDDGQLVLVVISPFLFPMAFFHA